MKLWAFNMDKKSWKKKRDKRDLHKKFSMSYDSWKASYPHYEHEAWCRLYKKIVYKKYELYTGLEVNAVDQVRSICYWTYVEPSYKDKPKVKRGTETLSDYRWYGRCPKYWNKMFHIRPVRRKWKQFIIAAVQEVYAESWDEPDTYEIVYLWEGLPMPSHKAHVYYY